MSTLTPLRLTHNEREALVALLQVHQHVGLIQLRNVPLNALLDKFLSLEVDPVGKVSPVDTNQEIEYVSFDLVYSDANRVSAIKLIREIFGIGLKEAKDLSDTADYIPNQNRVLRINLSDYDIARAEAAVAATNRVANWDRDSARPNIILTRVQ